MSAEELLRKMRETIESTLPKGIDVSEVDFEGPWLAIYSTTPEKFADQSDVVRKLAKQLQKRILVRPHPSALMKIEQAEAEIRNIVPVEADISGIHWEPDIGEVTLEVTKPGLAIGSGASTLNEVRRAIGWAPRVIRTPPIASKTVDEIRGYIRNMGESRRETLRRIGRQLHRDVDKSKKPWVRMVGLGAFREVGRSCSMLQTQETKVLIDCGVKFNQDDPETPYVHVGEVMPLKTVDAVVVTHAHLDHSGLIPLLFRLGYEGPVFCTQPTRDLMTLLQLDYLKVAAANGARPPYSSDHIRQCIQHTITLDYGSTTDITPDMRLTLFNAGHIIGSSVCHFHVGDGLYNIAFTGDIKYERTWLFNPAQNKFPRCEALVMEATYGGNQDFQPARKNSSQGMREVCQATYKRGGNVIVPVFAVGRSQEVMIVLEYLMRTEQIPKVPVYLDGMIWEATAIHTAYPEYLNNQLRNQVFQRGENPLLSDIFTRVDSFDKRNEICDSTEPCIVLATSGMITGGPIMEYIKSWGPDERHSLVFVGFQAEGTLGRRIMRGQTEIPVREGPGPKDFKAIRLAMDVTTVDGFSGHSDRRQLMNYIANMDPRPDRVILGHGEESKCIELASALHRKFGMETRALMNLETVRFR